MKIAKKRKLTAFRCMERLFRILKSQTKRYKFQAYNLTPKTLFIKEKAAIFMTAV